MTDLVTTEKPEPFPIGKRLALAFGAVTVLAALQGISHVFLVSNVAEAVGQMQHEEHAIRGGLELAKSIREQYMHAAHTIIAGDRSHLDHYASWVTRAQQGASDLKAVAPSSAQWRLDRVIARSKALDQIFRERILPAQDRGDLASVRRAHFEATLLSERAAQDADAIARVFEGRMAQSHVDTTHTTRLGFALAFGGILLIVIVAVVSTVQLRTAVIAPLRRLTEAAIDIGHGKFHGPVGAVGHGEFRELASAFELMTEELKKREEQLVQSERMAAIGQLAAGVAHEINNPIGVIRGYLRTMLPEAQGDTLKEELRILDEEAEACQRIAEDLLAYARAPEVTTGEVDVGALLEESARRFMATEEAAHVGVEVRARACVIQADAVRLRQVIANLLRNAVQAGSKEIVVVGERSSDFEYVFRVADRGAGMSVEQRARAFEPFFTGRKGGTGLGLAVCQGIIRAHAGTIVATNRHGGGSELVVTLPVRASQVP